MEIRLNSIEQWPTWARQALRKEISTLVAEAFQEDLNESGDVTTRAIFSPEIRGRARVFAKDSGTVAGLAVAQEVFRFADPSLRVQTALQDGERVQEGENLLTVEGAVVNLLEAERIALNFLGRLSGIATLTQRFVEAVAGTHAQILDTRKTTPGWRLLEKYAVRQGGGVNHRLGLFDMVLIKDNHIQAAGGITPAVERVYRSFENTNRRLPIEVEVKNLDELAETLTLKVDRILLDNMSVSMLREAVRMTNGRVPLEASGGVSLNTVRKIAETGVDFISVGALTHSASALDLSMLVE